MIIFLKKLAWKLPFCRGILWRLLPHGVYCFNYHRIGVKEDTLYDPNVFSCTPETFEQHLLFYKKHFEVISVDQLAQLYTLPSLDKKYALITFDDGYQDNYQYALPLLKKHQVPAILFVATDFIEKKSLSWWNEVAWIVRHSQDEYLKKTPWLANVNFVQSPLDEKIRDILKAFKQTETVSIEDKLCQLRNSTNMLLNATEESKTLFADWEMLRIMSKNGITIGSHTCTHAILSHLTDEQQQFELEQSKRIIEEKLSIPVDYFAYPVGGSDAFNTTTEVIAQNVGYKLAFSFISGVNEKLEYHNKYRLLRIGISDNLPVDMLRRTVVLANQKQHTVDFQGDVVILASGPNGLGTIRSFYAKGIRVIAVNLSTEDVSNYSSLPKAVHTIHAETVQERQQLLLNFLKGLSKEAVIIPTTDWFVSVLSQYENELKKNCRFVLPSKEVTNLLIDKAEETRVIGGVVPIPKTIQNITGKDQLINELALPIIIKPRSHKHMVLGQKNLILTSEQDVERFIIDYHGKLNNLIAQKIILGEDNQQWVCNCVFDNNSNMIQGFTFNRLKLSPSHYGVTSYAKSVFNEEIINLSKQIAKAIKYVGPAMIEFKFDSQDGHYKYIELNPRLGMCNYFDTSCGVNNSYATYLMAIGAPCPKNDQIQSEKMFISLYEDYFSRKRDGETTISILKDYFSNSNNPHVFIYYANCDPYPAIKMAIRQITSFISSRYKKLRG